MDAELEALRFNNCIAAMMTFVNVGTKWAGPLHPAVAADFAKLLAPFAPHLAEELWQAKLGRPRSVALAAWPAPVAEAEGEAEQTVAVRSSGPPSTRAPAQLSTAVYNGGRCLLGLKASGALRS